MQSILVLDQRMSDDYAQRGRTLNQAARSLVNRLLGCWQHDLSRPFTRNGKSYRVCVKCGMSKDFNVATWQTHGASYALPLSSSSGN